MCLSTRRNSNLSESISEAECNWGCLFSNLAVIYEAKAIVSPIANDIDIEPIP